MAAGRPTIEPTPRWQPPAAWAAGLAASLGIWSWWQGQGGTLPIPGVVSWASVLLLAVGVGWLALTTRRTLSADRTRLDNDQAVTRVLLGKASQLGGALLSGGYAGIALLTVPLLPAPLAEERLLHGVLSAVVALVWALAGGVLEASCRAEPPSDDPDEDAPGRAG